MKPYSQYTKRPSLWTPLLKSGAIVAGVLCAAVTAWTAPTDIANEPLAAPVSNTKPNIMFVLDDSGSMAWDYSPDYVDDSNCLDALDSNNHIRDGLNSCRIGDPPYNAAQYNKQYYNPAITYRPGLNYDNTERTNMNAANTTNWTAVPTDPYGQQQTDQLGNSVTTVNLVTGYPDRVWCTSRADSATDTTLCKTNTGYNYPTVTGVATSSFGYGTTTGGSRKYKYGAPYYYTISATEYCSDINLTTCNAQGAPTAAFPYPAPVRYCTDTSTTSGTYGNCSAKRINVGGNNYRYPKFAGKVVAGAGAIAAASATADLTINAGGSTAVGITRIDVNEAGTLDRITPPAGFAGADITVGATTFNSATGVITASTGTDNSTKRNDTADVIRQAINRYTATSGYSATRSNNVVTVTRNLVGAAPNGYSLVVTAPSAGGQASRGRFTVNSVANPSSITVSVNGINISGTVNCNLSNTSGNRTTCANNIASAINSFTSTPDYTASNSGADVTISAPVGLGATPNGWSVSPAGTVGSSAIQNMGVNQLGITASLPYSTTAFAGGADAVAAGVDSRTGVGTFSRTDIVSGSTYPWPVGSVRSDCAANPCTYAEEMTNFANWYSYYRTRMQMMKTSAGRAFGPIGDSFRVGFITINPMSSGSVSSSRYLKINDFTTGAGGQKQSWYSKFYGTGFNGSTPLREALSRVGWIYAGKLNTGLTTGIPTTDDPVQFSCQPNFTILSTDGYWNGNGSQNLSGTAIGNMDSDPTDAYSRFISVATGSPPVSASEGVYEGAGSASSGSLSDVAQYYYKTDLRPSMADNMRARGRDSAPHQHMTTFTVGLGLDGELDYVNAQYETSTSGDFYDIRRGAKVWPVPVADSPSALDDLWHTAVNGRGNFYSASNPEELVNGLVDALNTLQAALGAGAAAATSNLRPVAGDNFAFAGEYTTVDWIGDIKAFTLDLTTGAVSKNALWSARQALDARAYDSRVIYTFDSADVSSGNGLRHFCAPTSVGSTNCTDGAGLTASEMNFFLLNQLTQFPSMTAAQKAVSSSTLVNFIRGDTANEQVSAGLVTDLYRNRSSVMGDIVGSKPFYAKTSNLSYGDTGYAAFAACTQGVGTGCPATQFPTPSVPRRPTVYVAGNDGMLHAFETDVNNSPYYQTAGITTDTTSDDTFNAGNNTGNGAERWAYIPQFLLPKLHKLANDPYTHQFINDGSPIVSDVCISTPCAGLNDWRTILVASVGAGGRGYYALDVTNPLAPKGLWEFTSSATCATAADITAGTVFADCHLGLSFGNPVIAKRKSDGKWVVIVTSGHNNINPGNGQGYLYVLEATTGKVLHRISTGVGTGGTAGASYNDANPSGLGKVTVWADTPLSDATALAAYAGDTLGNMWRFDLDSTSAGYLTATKLISAVSSTGVAQPITVAPELAKVNGKRVIAFGTGKFIGTSDKASTMGHTVYAVTDELTATVATRGAMVQHTAVVDAAGTSRSVSASASVAGLWSGSNRGWFVDFPISAGAGVNTPSERVFVDPILQAGSLVVASSAPDTSDACSAGGYSWLNSFDIRTGTLPPGATAGTSAGVRVTGIIVGFSLIQLPSGEVKAALRLNSGETIVRDPAVTTGSYGGRRVTWRELTGPQQ